MLSLKIFEVNPLGVNCYVVSDETKQAVVIDCGCFHHDEWKEILEYINSNDLKVRHLLCTHLHFDHIMGIPNAVKTLGVNPEAHKGDLYIYNNVEEQINKFMGTTLSHINMPPLNRELKDGDNIEFGSHTFIVLHTPGHSLGSICFYCKEENILFSGDTLFRMSIGRTDLDGGNHKEIMQSLERIKTLPSTTIIYPGHGPKSIIAEEVRYNPYMA